MSSSSLHPSKAMCQCLETSQALFEGFSCNSCWRMRRSQSSYSLPVRCVDHQLGHIKCCHSRTYSVDFQLYFKSHKNIVFTFKNYSHFKQSTFIFRDSTIFRQSSPVKHLQNANQVPDIKSGLICFICLEVTRKWITPGLLTLSVVQYY